MFDLVIQGGRVVDGTGAAAFRSDIGVTGDRIAAIGDLAGVQAGQVLDGHGMVVAPGFIDIHSHSDFTLLIDPRAHSQIYQGVTTELVGNCGHGCAPLGPNIEAFAGNIYGYQDLLPIDWATMEGYLARLEEAGPAVNVATLVPNGNLRLAAVDDVRRPATAEEAARMARLLEEGLDAGAFGFSTGTPLDGPPRWSVCHPSRAGGLRGGTPRVVEFDAHTRLHGITNLSAVLPSWAADGGPGQLRRYLGDPATRERLKRYESIISSFGLGGWDRVALFCSEGSPGKVGHSIAELTPSGHDPCRVTARRGGLYATHERNRELLALEAVEEGLRAAAVTGVRLQLSHIIPRRGGPEDSLERCIEVVETAHANGLDVEFDAHTRLHGITNLSAVLPSWAADGGPGQLRRYLGDPATRERLKRYESIISSFGLGGWDRVALFCSEGSPGKVGHSIAELTPSGRDPYDTMYDLLLDEGDDPHGALLIVHSYDDDMLAQTFSHPLCTTESDATALCTDGPLADTTFLGAYTWAGLFFRTMVRERRELALEEAVHKLTAQAADRIGIGDRGRLVEGRRADIVVFDPDQFTDRGTLDDPNRPAAGVRHVLVNGGPTLIDGVGTGCRTGQVLRR